MKFERATDTHIWHDKDDGAHNGEYVGKITIDDENQAWLVNLANLMSLSKEDLRLIADKMDELEKE